MKNTISFSLLVIAFFAVVSLTTSCGEQTLSPVQYNDSVLYYYTILDRQIANLYKSIYDEKVTAKDLKDEYDLTIKMYNDNLPKLKKIKPLKNDVWFHASVVKFYDAVNQTLNNEFKEIIGYYSQDWDETFGPKIDNLSEVILDKITKEEEAVIDAQKNFAAAYNITLQ